MKEEEQHQTAFSMQATLKASFLVFFCVRVHVAPLSERVCGEREDERGVGDIFELATQKPITTGCSLTASFLTGSFTARTLFIHQFSKDETGGQNVGGERLRETRGIRCRGPAALLGCARR